MSNVNTIPHVEAESVSKGAQRARYTAYVQCVRKLEHKAKADKQSREKAARMEVPYDEF